MSSTNGTLAGAPLNGFDINNNVNRFNPSMAIIIVVLISALFAVVFFSIYIRRCTRGYNESSRQNAGGNANLNQLVEGHGRPVELGLDKAIVDTLPVVSYSVVKNLKEGKEGLECAVCLERFEEDGNLRLLPKCSHVFHLECIDVWFHSHSTCPLCRSSLLPTFSELTAGVPAVGDVSRRILEAQEETFGSTRQLPLPGDDESTILHDEELPQGGSDRGRNIGRANDRNSAQLALSRNSDSFRQAARGVEVRERLAVVSARYPASSSELGKGPQTASSLNCVNFSLPRAGSLTASGRRDFYNIDIFPFGSQRFGASGVFSSNSGTNDCELQRVGDLGHKNLDAKWTEEGSSLPGSSEHWITIDLHDHQNESRSAHSDSTAQPRTADVDSGLVWTTTPSVQRALSGKPHRSGPLLAKTSNAVNDKTGGGEWEQRAKTERRGSS